MGFRRSGSSDQRRRRVLLEEQQPRRELAGMGSDGLVAETAAVRPRGRRRRYAEAATADPHAPMTAVIPQRSWTLLLLLLAGLCLIAGVQALYGHVGLRASQPGWDALTGWDVSQAGSLAGWLCSMLLLAAGFQGVQIYRLRRHREDDYQGRYQVWLWAAPAIWLLALAAGTQAPQGLVRAGLQTWVGSEHWAAGVAPDLVPAALWLLLALRLVFELRESRLALTSLACSTILVPVAAAIPAVFAPHPVILTLPMLASSLAMMGHLAAFLAVASYARHVYLDAHGQLNPPAGARSEEPAVPSRSAQPVAARSVPENVAPADSSLSALPAAPAAKPEKEQPAPVTESVAKAPSHARQVAESASETQVAASDTKTPAAGQSKPEQETSDPPLSKAARRRLRKMQRREQGRRAA